MDYRLNRSDVLELNKKGKRLLPFFVYSSYYMVLPGYAWISYSLLKVNRWDGSIHYYTNCLIRFTNSFPYFFFLNSPIPLISPNASMVVGREILSRCNTLSDRTIYAGRPSWSAICFRNPRSASNKSSFSPPGIPKGSSFAMTTFFFFPFPVSGLFLIQLLLMPPFSSQMPHVPCCPWRLQNSLPS